MQGEELKNKLEQAQNIAIFGHQSIDGDAIGSMFWLWLQLEKLWKNISYFTPDEPSETFSFLELFLIKPILSIHKCSPKSRHKILIFC